MSLNSSKITRWGGDSFTERSKKTLGLIIVSGLPLGSFTRNFSSSTSNLTKVAILGAAGGIGQPLSLLMKQSSLVSDLALYDIRGSPGVAADVSHVNTSAKCHGYLPDNNGLEKTLDGASIILLPAGVPRKPGMSRDDLFNTNASIVRDLATAAAKVAPKAHMLIIANPVNSTVPIVGEVYKKAGVFDPKRLFGVTTLDVVRASAFLSEIAKTSPSKTRVQVVGGHSGVTIVPLLSQLKEGQNVKGEAYKALVKRIQFGGDEVVQAKDGAGSATLSMAYAAAVFADSLLKALGGAQGIVEPTFVKSPHYQGQGVEYFASNVELGSEGVKEILPIGPISKEEEELIKACLPELKKNIEKGVKFVQ
ncbi:lactate/malate dehydrogenase [Phakopsora pachyrhizi]|uniref:Malate dehydrogenase n=1 Tax=Phakopsora pachyrhizi TaxID=170000 RepID=A0AAV0AQF6_PHAPC|nr:lactate/malate dehydrogenase [Phakopsora pachyrhizi]